MMMDTIQRRSKNVVNGKPVLICYLKVSERPDTCDEFKSLVETAGYTIVELFKVNDASNSQYYFTIGNIRKIQHILGRNRDIRLVIFGTLLTPLQYSNLERKLKKVAIMDTMELILRIFGSRTTRRETKLELQLAALKYQLSFKRNFLQEHSTVLHELGYGDAKDLDILKIPYSRMGFHLAIKHIERKLEKLRLSRENQRKSRLKKADRGELVTISVVGYTNAGKSSFLNSITDSSIKTANKLFTTLSTTTRRLIYFDLPILLTDTVGFFQDLPEELLGSFTSTLEESLCSDIILLLLDCSESIDEIKRKLTASFDVLKLIDEKFPEKLWFLVTKTDLVTNKEVKTKTESIFEIISEKSNFLNFDNVMIESISSFKRDLIGFYQLVDRKFPEEVIRLKISFNYPELLSLMYNTFTVLKEQKNETSWHLEIRTRKSYVLNAFKKNYGEKIGIY
ncbi:MAG: GTPase [Candidatus Hodarchaeales archaeon]|jgi:GTP-binding protein HflX